MKKIVIYALTLIYMLSLIGCGVKGKAVLYMDSYEWKMQTVMNNDTELTSNEDSLVIAVGKPDTLYPNAPIVNLLLTASNGTITLVDATNNQTYDGTYKLIEEASKEVHYEISIDGVTGLAVVSTNGHFSETVVLTLAINMSDYSVYFLINEENVV